jgi:prevent-host-death family protein
MDIGIEEARKQLGPLVTAVQQGTDVVLTRNGRPVARIIRYQEDTRMKVYARRDVPWDPPAESHVVGRFDQYAARYWDLEISDTGDVIDTRRTRLWRTADDRWVVTRPGAGDHYYVTDDEVDQMFAANDIPADAREARARTLSPPAI